jgi:hypothetical protein
VIVNDVHEKRNCSLSKLAKDLDLIRTGMQHQAGSDSFITILCYHKILDDYFEKDESELKRFVNKVYGLTQDTMYTSSMVTSSTMVNNNGMDMIGGMYYPGFVYPSFYNNMGFQDNGGYYYDQQLFNAYNYNPMQGGGFNGMNSSNNR